MDDKKQRTIVITIVAMGFFIIIAFSIMGFWEKKWREGLSDTAVEENEDNEDAGKYQLVDVSDKIVSEDSIDESVEDAAIHETEVEKSYINTTELLPSVKNERVVVDKAHISDNNFPVASIDKKKSIAEFKTAHITYPQSVKMYNAHSEKSASAEIELDVDDNDNLIKSIGWTSGNQDIITTEQKTGTDSVISKTDKNFEGTVQIYIMVTYVVDENTTTSEEFAIDIEICNMEDEDACLYDTDGVQLFLDKDGKNVAYLSDYSKQERFYGAIRTTGWQNIDGDNYYFNSKGTPVTGKQIIGGITYSFDEEGVLVDSGMAPITDFHFGIDVSKYQKEIDWQQVADSDVQFAIIRCGYRGAVSGTLVEDPYFRKNIEGATAAGVKVGVYFFTQAITEKEAIEEASMAVELCKNYNVSLPIFIDSENAINGRANNISVSTRTKCLKAFCETINNSGYVGGVYASKCWYYDKVNASELEKYCIWVAQYNTECTYKGKKDYWQYSSSEHIRGIEGNVDVNIKY